MAVKLGKNKDLPHTLINVIFSDDFGNKIQIARRKYPAKRTYKQAQTISFSIRFIYNCHKSQIKIVREIKSSLFRNCVKDNIRYAFWMCHMNYMWSINFFLAINETVLFSVFFHDIQSGLIKSHGLVSDLVPKNVRKVRILEKLCYHLFLSIN